MDWATPRYTRPVQQRLSNPMASAIAKSILPRVRGRHALAPEFVIAAARDRGRENPTTQKSRQPSGSRRLYVSERPSRNPA